jgi:hypothetical protein
MARLPAAAEFLIFSFQTKEDGIEVRVQGDTQSETYGKTF